MLFVRQFVGYQLIKDFYAIRFHTFISYSTIVFPSSVFFLFQFTDTSKFPLDKYIGYW